MSSQLSNRLFSSFWYLDILIRGIEYTNYKFNFLNYPVFVLQVLRDTKSSSDDHITREDDPAILKSLDTSPESDTSSPAREPEASCE